MYIYGSGGKWQSLMFPEILTCLSMHIYVWSFPLTHRQRWTWGGGWTRSRPTRRKFGKTRTSPGRAASSLQMELALLTLALEARKCVTKLRIIERMICFLMVVFLNVSVYIFFNFIMHFIKCIASINFNFSSSWATSLFDLCCAHCT